MKIRTMSVGIRWCEATDVGVRTANALSVHRCDDRDNRHWHQNDNMMVVRPWSNAPITDELGRMICDQEQSDVLDPPGAELRLLTSPLGYRCRCDVITWTL